MVGTTVNLEIARYQYPVAIDFSPVDRLSGGRREPPSQGGYVACIDIYSCANAAIRKAYG